jgi:hypothetical protein
MASKVENAVGAAARAAVLLDYFEAREGAVQLPLGELAALASAYAQVSIALTARETLTELKRHHSVIEAQGGER